MDTITYKELKCKILLLGDVNVGKTSILQTYTQTKPYANDIVTIGIDFSTKILNWNDKLDIKLQIWDTVGQEKFKSISRSYYSNAHAAFVVFDVDNCNSDTFDSVKRWKNEIDKYVTISNTEIPIPIILLANKIDLVSSPDNIRKKTPEEMDQFCTDNGFVDWFEVSAKDNLNIDNAFNTLITEILKYEEHLPSCLHTESLNIDDSNETSINSYCCS